MFSVLKAVVLLCICRNTHYLIFLALCVSLMDNIMYPDRLYFQVCPEVFHIQYSLREHTRLHRLPTVSREHHHNR